MKEQQIIKKMCHNCLKRQELDRFRKQLMRVDGDGQPNEYFEQDVCILCEEMGYAAKKVHEHRAFKREREDGRTEENGREARTLRDSYECAFVGNTDYKDICKTYKIKL